MHPPEIRASVKERWGDGRPTLTRRDLFYGLHVEVVNVGRTVEALRRVTVEDAEGLVLAPHCQSKKPSKPLTREQPVMELIALPGKLHERGTSTWWPNSRGREVSIRSREAGWLRADVSQGGE
jgi:hypothetical protein